MADWHPIMAAVEVEPAVWVMFAQYQRPYGVIRLVKRGNEIGYRADTWAEQLERREVVGYFRTLRAAAMAIHQRYLSAMVTRVPVNIIGGRQSQPHGSTTKDPSTSS